MGCGRSDGAEEGEDGLPRLTELHGRKVEADIAEDKERERSCRAELRTILEIVCPERTKERICCSTCGVLGQAKQERLPAQERLEWAPAAGGTQMQRSFVYASCGVSARATTAPNGRFRRRPSMVEAKKMGKKPVSKQKILDGKRSIREWNKILFVVCDERYVLRVEFHGGTQKPPLIVVHGSCS